MRLLQAMVANRSDRLDRSDRSDRDRNRFLFWLASGPHGPLKLRCQVVSAPQQYGCGTRFLTPESHHASLRYRDR